MKQQFYLGQWRVDVSSNTLSQGKTKKSIEPKAMDVLLLLCQQKGLVVSADEIVAQCWPNAPIGDNPVHKAITNLRRALGDKAAAPSYIETIRKRGYRVVAEVQFIDDEQSKAVEGKWVDTSPFVGLSAFSSNESQVFFGRDALVRDLISKAAELFNRQRPFMLVLGPSGSGKSSLIHAGFLPKLLSKKGINGIYASDHLSFDLADINIDTSAFTIVEEIAIRMLDWGNNETGLFDGFSASILAEKLLSSPQQIIDRVKSWLDVYEPNTTNSYSCFVIVIDRLEVFLADTTIDEKDKRTIFTLLEALSESNLFLVVLISRNDFYPQISTFDILMKNKGRGAHIDVSPPSVSELGQVIKLPAIAADLSWEKDEATNATLDDIILGDAALAPNCLPLLQYTLQELYWQREGKVLKNKTYQALGKIDGAIGFKAESTFIKMPHAVQNALSSILPLIINLSGSNTITSKTAPWESLDNENERCFVELMVEQRLFVSFLNQGRACFKVAHEAVLSKWERVQQWIMEHQSALSAKAALNQQTQLWIENSFAEAYLIPAGKPLLDASALLTANYIRLTNEEKKLIKHSQRKVRARNLFKGLTAALLATLAVLSFAAMLHSQQSQALAERKRLEAENLMGFMIGDFADTLRRVKRMDLLEGVSQHALKYVAEAQENSAGWLNSTSPKPSFELRFQHALSLQAMAEVRFYRDDTEQALMLYEEADTRLLELLEEAEQHFELLKAAGANAFWIGHIHNTHNNDFDSAQSYFERYLKHSETMLFVKPSDSTAKLEVAYAKSSLGSLAYDRYQFEQASSLFKASLALKKEVSEGTENSEDAKLYATNSLSWIASANIHLGKYKDAYTIFSQAETVLDEIGQSDSANGSIIENHVAILIQKANLEKFLGLNQAYEQSLSQAYASILRALAQDPENSAWQKDKATVESYLIQSELPLKASVDIDALLSQSISLDIPWVTNRVAETLQMDGHWQKAKPSIDYFITSFSDDGISNDITHLENAIVTLKSLLLIHRQKNESNDKQLALTYCQKAAQRANELIRMSKHPDIILAFNYTKRCRQIDENLKMSVDKYLSQLTPIKYSQLQKGN